MKYNPLGQSNLTVSQVAMGCMSLKGDTGTSAKVIHEAIDLGINFFDTADLYDQGENETLLGLALGQKRKEVIVATKVGNQWNPQGTAWSWNPRKAYIMQAIEASLTRLKTDYIDVYQLHGGTIEDPIDEVIEIFELLKDQGKIRAYGISSVRPNVIRSYAERSNMASVMMQYSLLDRRPEETCLELLHNKKISVITRGTLAKGLLVDKPARTYVGHSQNSVKTAADTVHTIVAKNNTSASLTACQYVLQTPSVVSAVVGFRTKEQLTSCISGADIARLNEEDYQLLQNAVIAHKYEAHR